MVLFGKIGLVDGISSVSVLPHLSLGSGTVIVDAFLEINPFPLSNTTLDPASFKLSISNIDSMSRHIKHLDKVSTSETARAGRCSRISKFDSR
jgi:hypothetical protein